MDATSAEHASEVMFDQQSELLLNIRLYSMWCIILQSARPSDNLFWEATGLIRFHRWIRDTVQHSACKLIVWCCCAEMADGWSSKRLAVVCRSPLKKSTWIWHWRRMGLERAWTVTRWGCPRHILLFCVFIGVMTWPLLETLYSNTAHHSAKQPLLLGGSNSHLSKRTLHRCASVLFWAWQSYSVLSVRGTCTWLVIFPHLQLATLKFSSHGIAELHIFHSPTQVQSEDPESWLHMTHVERCGEISCRWPLWGSTQVNQPVWHEDHNLCKYYNSRNSSSELAVVFEACFTTIITLIIITHDSLHSQLWKTMMLPRQSSQ